MRRTAKGRAATARSGDTSLGSKPPSFCTEASAIIDAGPSKDVVCEIRRTLFNGIRKLSTSDERPHGFTDPALQELRALAEQRALMDEIAVIVDEKEELIQWSFIERIERMTHNDFEALSSVVGTLESISVGKNGRFSVRSEITGRPVMCRFKRDQFTG